MTEVSEPIHRAALCICADDFGLHAGVNDAVARLASVGRLQAVGALVGAPAWKAGVQVLRRLEAEGLDVGLHLDLTEFPLMPGTRRPLGRLVALAILRRLDRTRLRAEIRAQLDSFEAELGNAPAFIDGHQHVHQLPCIRDELLAELQSRYGRYRPWIRCTRTVPMVTNSRLHASSRIKASTIQWLGSRRLSAAVSQHGFAQNRGLLGVYDFQGGAPRYLTLLQNWLAAARDGDLLMCHPGLRATTGEPLGLAREAEYEILAGRAFGELIKSSGVSLWPMSQLLNHRA